MLSTLFLFQFFTYLVLEDTFDFLFVSNEMPLACIGVNVLNNMIVSWQLKKNIYKYFIPF
jgi:hypothetical protein